MTSKYLYVESCRRAACTETVGQQLCQQVVGHQQWAPHTRHHMRPRSCHAAPVRRRAALRRAAGHALRRSVSSACLTWLTQYEFSTRRAPSLRPARSSAIERWLRLGFSWVIPWLTGLPYTIPCAGQDAARSDQSNPTTCQVCLRLHASDRPQLRCVVDLHQKQLPHCAMPGKEKMSMRCWCRHRLQAPCQGLLRCRPPMVPTLLLAHTLETGLLRPPRRTRTRYTTKPCLAL
jgi:hypothetical protein